MSRTQREFIEFIKLGLLITLSSLVAGAAFAVYELGEFSPLPAFVSFLIPLIVGGSIGVLTRSLGQALLAVILISLLGIGVMMSALLYPELRGDYLGIEVVGAFSLRKAVISGFLFIFPLTLIGVLIGMLFRE